MSFDCQALLNALEGQGALIRVLVAGVAGSVPREAGAEMLVFAGGQTGTIGGGALEFRATERARAMLAEWRARVGNECPVMLEKVPLGPGLGQCCGGAVVLAYEAFDAAHLAAQPEAPLRVRRIAGPKDMPLALRRKLQAARGGALAGPAETQVIEGWLVEPLAMARRPLWVWGAGHVGRAIVAVLAPLPDLAITWIDTAPDRFPALIPQGVTAVSAADPAPLAGHAPKDTRHLVLTYSHALDLELCHRLLGRGFDRLGLIGSASKWARFRARLAALGHLPAEIARIDCPIGDPSFGKHPQAIAIGVAAALLREWGTALVGKERAG